MIWFDRFAMGLFFMAAIGLVGYLAWHIVASGWLLVAILFVIAALGAGYVMEKLGVLL